MFMYVSKLDLNLFYDRFSPFLFTNQLLNSLVSSVLANGFIGYNLIIIVDAAIDRCLTQIRLCSSFLF